MNLLARRSHALRFRDAKEMQSINLNANLFLIYFIGRKTAYLQEDGRLFTFRFLNKDY